MKICKKDELKVEIVTSKNKLRWNDWRIATQQQLLFGKKRKFPIHFHFYFKTWKKEKSLCETKRKKYAGRMRKTKQ
jgi:hypothetical protein